MGLWRLTWSCGFLVRHLLTLLLEVVLGICWLESVVVNCRLTFVFLYVGCCLLSLWQCGVQAFCFCRIWEFSLWCRVVVSVVHSIVVKPGWGRRVVVLWLLVLVV